MQSIEANPRTAILGPRNRKLAPPGIKPPLRDVDVLILGQVVPHRRVRPVCADEEVKRHAEVGLGLVGVLERGVGKDGDLGVEVRVEELAVEVCFYVGHGEDTVEEDVAKGTSADNSECLGVELVGVSREWCWEMGLEPFRQRGT